MAMASSSWPESTTTGTPGAFSITLRKVSAPWLSGRLRSSNTSDGISLAMAASPSERRLAQSTRTEGRLSTNRRRTRSASPGLSSISNTWARVSFIILLGRQARVAEPKFLDGAHCRKETLQIAGFGDITIRTEFVAQSDVLLRCGTAEHDHRNMTQFRQSFDFGQNFMAVAVGQIEIQNHEIGTNRMRIAATAAQKCDRLVGANDEVD